MCEIIHSENDRKGSAGRAALYSSYDRNCFGNIEIKPIGEEPYVTRYDCTDGIIEYCGEWKHDCMSSFRNFRRTVSKGRAGSRVTVRFHGTGFALTGDSGGQSAVVSVSLDGGESSTVPLPKSEAREIR